MAWNQIKYSMLNLRSSDFSIREESMDSQILSSPRPLSIASEPSDLKNWFPSYQYESPALKSNSFLDDTVVPETEMEENSGGFERNGTKNEAFIPKNETPNGVVKCGSFSGYEHESHLLSKIPSSLESTSFVSEPTDIRNWYSSYAYESLSLDTIDGVGNSICEVSKHEEDGFLVENNRGKEKVSEDFSINRSDSEEVSGRAPKEERQPVRENMLCMATTIISKIFMDIKPDASSFCGCTTVSSSLHRNLEHHQRPHTWIRLTKLTTESLLL